MGAIDEIMPEKFGKTDYKAHIATYCPIPESGELDMLSYFFIPELQKIFLDDGIRFCLPVVT